MKRWLLCTFTALLLAAAPARGDDAGMWNFLQATCHLGSSPFYVGLRAEYRSCQQFVATDLWYLRPLAGWRIAPWLKWEVMADYMRKPGAVQIYQAMTGLTFAHRAGPLGVTLRERYLYSRNETAGTVRHNLRSYLKASYALANSRLTPYLAVELFTWTGWEKTRHYAGASLKLDERCSLEMYYLYHTFVSRPASHLLGLGCNLTL